MNHQVCYSYLKKSTRKLNNLILSFLYYLNSSSMVRGWKGRRMETNSFPWTSVLKCLLPVQRESWQMAEWLSLMADSRLTHQCCCPFSRAAKPETGDLKGQQEHRDIEKTGKADTLHLAPQTREIFLVMYTDVTFGCVASQCLPKTLICILSSIHFILNYSIPAPKQSDWCDPMQESMILCTSDHYH